MKKVSEIHKCKVCDFETQSGTGLKIHMKRKHTSLENTKYPSQCDLCDKQIESDTAMKKHMMTHSFKRANYKCIECEFVGETDLTMEVHIGKQHSENFELCKTAGESSR